MDNNTEVMNEDKFEDISMERMMEFLESKKVYRCTYPKCKAYFDRPYRLAQHILAHNNIRPYLCQQPNCGKAYTSKSHLDRHLRTVHMPQENDVVFSCPRCFKTFANRQNLKRHLNTVHNMEFACETCDMQFKKKNQLTTHMYQHTGIKAFSCDKCSESFVSLYLKKRHMRYHKIYKCEECRVEFNHWSKYQKHMKTEHQKDEFICNECGRSFKQRCHIVRHVKIHAGTTRTFLCPYENCERFYSRNSNLKQHILVKHMDILHECMICHARLSTKAKLNYHVQLHYNSGMDGQPTKLKTTERKERKDVGSLKSSTALKLAGLTKAPGNTQAALSSLGRVHDELRSTINTFIDLPENLQSTFAASTKVPECDQSNGPELSKKADDVNGASSGNNKLEVSNSPPPLNLTVKTEYIEIEVDIPYDI